MRERNAIKDLLEDMAHASVERRAELTQRAKALGCDLTRPHLVLQAVPRPGPAERSWDDAAEALESAATRAFPGRCSTAGTRRCGD